MSTECDQFLAAAKEGRSDDMLELLDQGAHIECRTDGLFSVRNLFS